MSSLNFLISPTLQADDIETIEGTFDELFPEFEPSTSKKKIHKKMEKKISRSARKNESNSVMIREEIDISAYVPKVPQPGSKRNNRAVSAIPKTHNSYYENKVSVYYFISLP